MWFIYRSGLESVSGSFFPGRKKKAQKRGAGGGIYKLEWLFNSSPSADTEAYVPTTSLQQHYVFIFLQVFLNKHEHTHQPKVDYSTVQYSATSIQSYIACTDANRQMTKKGVAAYNSRFMFLHSLDELKYNRLQSCMMQK